MNRKYFDKLVIGLGKTGISCVRYLVSQNNTSFAVIDSRDEPPELKTLCRDFPEVPVYLGSFSEEIISGAGELIVSPGVSLEETAIRKAMSNGATVINDIEIFCREAVAPVIAVTGSNGKSTVATLVTEMINRAGKRVLLGGNIGIPALDLLNEEEPDYYVLELSSFQLEPLSSLRASASAVLNVCEDHMDRYRNIQEYAAVKQRIYAGDGLVVINLDDLLVAGFNYDGRRTSFYTLEEPEEGVFGIRGISGRRCLAIGREELMPVSSVSLHGDHNLSNCLAALALAQSTGLSMQPMLDTLADFRGLPHRCQWVANINGVDWFNDSKGTNVGASSAAIKGLRGSGQMVLIAGGIGKGADFTQLANVGRKTLNAMVLIGRDAKLIARAFADSIPVFYATSMEAAVETAASITKPGDVVLLSPACASFDMFDDYQHRGQVFMESVSKLKESEK